MLVTWCLKNQCCKCCQTQLHYMRAHVEHSLSAGVESSHHFKGPGISVLFISGVECSKLFLHTVCLHTPGIHPFTSTGGPIVAVLPLQAVKPPQLEASSSFVIRHQTGAAGSPPLGSRGTVVGVHEGALEVLFDADFIGGGDLQGRCQGRCGVMLPPADLLNLAKPHFSNITGLVMA